jgi:hypothetical protein
LLALPNDRELRQQMVNVEAEINRMGKVHIESKQDLRRRGVSSPDFLESLILTGAMGINNEIRLPPSETPGRAVSEYNPFSPEWMNDTGTGTSSRYYAPGWARLRG